PHLRGALCHMTAYYVVAFSTLLLALFSRYVTHHFAAPRGAIATARSEKTWSFFDLPILAILISASALRATSVGTDTQVYEWIFSGIPENRTLTEALSESTQEVGYTALSYAIKVSGGEFP